MSELNWLAVLAAATSIASGGYAFILIARGADTAADYIAGSNALGAMVVFGALAIVLAITAMIVGLSAN